MNAENLCTISCVNNNGKKIKNMNACSKHRGDLNSHGQTSLSVIQPALFLNVCGLCMSEGACGRTFVYNR